MDELFSHEPIQTTILHILNSIRFKNQPYRVQIILPRRRGKTYLAHQIQENPMIVPNIFKKDDKIAIFKPNLREDTGVDCFSCYQFRSHLRERNRSSMRGRRYDILDSIGSYNGIIFDDCNVDDISMISIILPNVPVIIIGSIDEVDDKTNIFNVWDYDKIVDVLHKIRVIPMNDIYE